MIGAELRPERPAIALARAADALHASASGAEPETLLRLTVPAPVADPLALRDLDLLWEPPTGPALAGIGTAAEIESSGVQRFERLRLEADRLFARVVELPGQRQHSPRLLGGIAFADGDRNELWRPFGSTRFRLPRLLYSRSDQNASLTVCANPAGIDLALAELGSALEQLASGFVPTAQPPLVARDDLDRQQWRQMVEHITEAIRAGELSKVVAARRSELRFHEPVSVRSALSRLRERYGDCFRLAFRAGDSFFVGAPPERLVALDGNRVSTEALAGSIAVGQDSDRALLASLKDRGEQEVVVHAIAAALAPFCSQVAIEEQPAVRRLRDVLHLRTPISATTAHATHVLSLVEALHPTPAVGGAPRSTALQWIAEREPGDRGWYAGPFGWFDANGAGEFAVAIRSGLIRGSEASLFAGAGIVQESEAGAEYEETTLKQRALLGALEVLE